MTAIAFLSGKLPSGESNGLAAIVRQLVDDPGAIHVMVVLADCVKVTKLVESGDTVPTVRLRRLEVITDAKDRESLRRLLMREFERRTGQPTLPLDLEEDVRSAFEGVTYDDDEKPATDPNPRGPGGRFVKRSDPGEPETSTDDEGDEK